MSGIQAMLEILSDWGPFTDDSLPEEARHRRRMQAVLMLEGIGRLAAYEHGAVMDVVNHFYRIQE